MKRSDYAICHLVELSASDHEVDGSTHCRSTCKSVLEQEAETQIELISRCLTHHAKCFK